MVGRQMIQDKELEIIVLLNNLNSSIDNYIIKNVCKTFVHNSPKHQFISLNHSGVTLKTVLSI